MNPRSLVKLFSHLALLAPTIPAQSLELGTPFTDNAVFQRDKPLPIYGTSVPGSIVRVEFADQIREETANEDGKWTVIFDPIAATANPLSVRVTTGNLTRTLNHILVGEVWMAAGQSNMEWRIMTSRPEDIATANTDHFDQIRFIRVPHSHSLEPRPTCGGTWTSSIRKEALGQLSAPAYFFARELHLKLKVPVGIIDPSYGGTSIDTWIPPQGWDSEQSLVEYHKRGLSLPESDKSGASRVFNSMVNPFVGFALRGFIWHQGEGNAQDGETYKTKLQALTKGYRQAWKDSQLHFGIGQLYPYEAPYLESPSQMDRFCRTCWAQAQAGAEIPNAGTILLADLGSPFDIHPDEKEEQGRRYALWARARVYGETGLTHCGPIPTRVEESPNEYHIYFDHVGEGLTTRDGQDPNWIRFRCEAGSQPPYRISISHDRRFLIVRKPAISGNPERSIQHSWHTAAIPNLMNSDGLPATMFELDLTRKDQIKRAEDQLAFPQVKPAAGLSSQRPAASEEGLTMCQIFSDGMILQRDKPVPVWGWATPGDTVTVAFGDFRLTTKSDVDGYWRVNLPAMPATFVSRSMTISTPSSKHDIQDVLVGEVWIGSGQSNMQWAIRESCAKSQLAFLEDDLPGLRVFQVAVDHAFQPQRSVEGRWIYNSDKATLHTTSGKLYFFGRKLQKELGVPVGLIHCSEGGSPIRAWIPIEGLQTEPLFERFHKQRLMAHGPDPEASGLGLDRAGIGNYDAMLHPLVPYAMRGFIWHQGEQDGSSGDNYRLMLHAMINGWRKVWNDPTIAVGIGQLYAFDAPYLETWKKRETWVETQFAQYRAGKEIDRTQCIVLNDLSTPFDIHPKNKLAAGERYAAWALGKIYGKKTLPGGPEPVSASRDPKSGDITITFDNAGEGLKSSDGRDIKWFQVFSPQSDQWMGLRARYTGVPNQLLLQYRGLKMIKGPVSVRHAWSNVAMPNLVNSDGMPASCFELQVP